MLCLAIQHLSSRRDFSNIVSMYMDYIWIYGYIYIGMDETYPHDS